MMKLVTAAAAAKSAPLTWDRFWETVRSILFSRALLTSVVILIAGIVLAKVLPKFVGMLLRKSSRVDEVAEKYILRTVRISIWAIVIVSIMDRLGFPVGSLLTVLAAVGAAVALAIKDNLSNFASGVVLLFTKPFKAGDFIEVDGYSGTIKSIEIMRSYLDTIENTCVAIPNTTMMTATIVNYSAYDTRRMGLEFTVSYDTDLAKAKEVLHDLVDNHPLILHEPDEPFVVVKEQGDSSIVLLVRVWCHTADYWALHFELMEKVKTAFDANGIEIPFPQLDVHMKPENSAQ